MTAPKPLGGAPDRPSALLTRRTAPAAVPWRAAMGDGDGGGDAGADGGDGDGGVAAIAAEAAEAVRSAAAQSAAHVACAQ